MKIVKKATLLRVSQPNFCLRAGQPMGLSLKELRLRNFKSFEGQHNISGLDSHLTAIVGPNGSGKSNVIDSILFVLGYRARKMRHTVLRDLITKGHADCEVELVFNEFRISRSLTVSGNSTERDASSRACVSRFFLNGSELSSTAAQDFLKLQGIDLDNNRFLILQGEIENIALLGPLDLLAYIEDCIGTVGYKLRIEEAEKRVKENDEEVITAGNKLKFAETDYLYKKNHRDEKICFLRSKAEALAMKHEIVLMKAENNRRKEMNLVKLKEESDETLRELVKRNSQKLSEIKELEERRDGIDMKARDEELLKVRRQVQVVARENSAMEARSEKLQNEIKKLECEVEEAIERKSQWNTLSSTYNEQLRRYLEEIELLERENAQRKKTLGENKVITRNEKRKKAYEQELMELLKRKEYFARNEAEIQQLRCRLEEIAGSPVVDAGDSSDRLVAVENELKVLQADLRATYSEIQKRRRSAEEFKFTEDQYRREKAVLNELGTIEGVHGMLKSLGTVRKEYEVALESAAKGLNSIVVDSTMVAEKCISVINKKNLNRTTFIILDKIPEIPRDDRLCKERPVPADLLYKKIACNNKYTKAFYFVLKDTLVVQTLEEAKHIAFGPVRRRVVTADGKLLEKSGVMSGGKSAKKLKGVTELEDIHTNITKLIEKKREEANSYKKILSEAEAWKKKKHAEMGLKEELERCLVNFKDGELHAIDEEISKLKGVISGSLYEGLGADVRLIREEMVLCDEKIEHLERECQDLRIKLSSAPHQDLEIKSRELEKLRNEIGKVKFITYDEKHLNKLEEEHRHCSSLFKEIQLAIGQLRNEMGKDYHEEAEKRAKLEEIVDSLSGCARVTSNCAVKCKTVQKEASLVMDLLERYSGRDEEAATEGVWESRPCFDEARVNEVLLDTGDEELKRGMKELLEKLNTKEIEDFKKLKLLYKETNETGISGELDEIHVYEEVFKEYESVRRGYGELKDTYAFFQSKSNTLREELSNLQGERHTLFMEGFNQINKNLKEILFLLTFGGSAELDLLDYLNPFTEGIVLSIMPPKKAWKQVSNLSGGEKTLASLSLIFALHKYRPSAFYVMDEIDAALDYKNVGVIAQYIKSINSQFIIISLRDNMFEMARTLLGIYKTHNSSKAILVDVDRLQV
ncbi:structural maintenance of chromosome 4 [Pancytospora epiphaga]|nr:structural maintenance of chromosome 4 [Pancytospora epiphaga]